MHLTLEGLSILKEYIRDSICRNIGIDHVWDMVMANKCKVIQFLETVSLFSFLQSHLPPEIS